MKVNLFGDGPTSVRSVAVLGCLVFYLFAGTTAAEVHAANIQPRAPQSSCALPPERRILDSLLNHNHDLAHSLIESTDFSHTMIRSKSFYQAALTWSRAHRKGNNPESDRLLREAASQIKKILRKLNNQTHAQSREEVILSTGLALSHGARMLLYSGQYLTGYRFGKQGIRLLNQFRQTASPTVEENAAISLILGLYEVYISNIPDHLKYLDYLVGKPALGHASKLETGIREIELAIKQSPHFASEAARALLMETPWNLNHICRQVNLADTMVAQYANNLDFSALYQGFLLKCGFAELALKENNRALASAGLDAAVGQRVNGKSSDTESWRTLFYKGRLRALADLGRAHELAQNPISSSALRPFYLAALANALDITAQRQRAVKIYTQIMNLADAPESLRRSAKMRLRYPYTRPKPRSSQLPIELAVCPKDHN